MNKQEKLEMLKSQKYDEDMFLFQRNELMGTSIVNKLMKPLIWDVGYAKDDHGYPQHWSYWLILALEQNTKVELLKKLRKLDTDVFRLKQYNPNTSKIRCPLTTEEQFEVIQIVFDDVIDTYGKVDIGTRLRVIQKNLILERQRKILDEEADMETDSVL